MTGPDENQFVVNYFQTMVLYFRYLHMYLLPYTVTLVVKRTWLSSAYQLLSAYVKLFFLTLPVKHILV